MHRYQVAVGANVLEAVVALQVLCRKLARNPVVGIDLVPVGAPLLGVDATEQNQEGSGATATVQVESRGRGVTLTDLPANEGTETPLLQPPQVPRNHL